MISAIIKAQLDFVTSIFVDLWICCCNIILLLQQIQTQLVTACRPDHLACGEGAHCPCPPLSSSSPKLSWWCSDWA